MHEIEPAPRLTTSILAIVLWLLTVVAGLNSIYLLKEIFYVIFSSLGGSMRVAEQIALGLVFLLGTAFTIFVIGSTEYHIKHVGKPKSWRLFVWSLAVEAGITVLYYIL